MVMDGISLDLHKNPVASDWGTPRDYMNGLIIKITTSERIVVSHWLVNRQQKADISSLDGTSAF